MLKLGDLFNPVDIPCFKG